ncbi:MAG TPA: response regulator [Anaerolineae bacterium]
MNTLRILIADDESLHLMNLRSQLEKLGHRVVAEADDGGAAINLAREFKPDLAILDIKMPGTDGIDAAQQIVAERPIPIILLSAFSESTLAESAAHAHVTEYLMKPVSENDLLPAITLALARFGELTEARQETASLRESLETRKLVERAKGILMRRLNLTEEEAFRRLQKRSQNENKKLGEIAQAIIVADGMM